MNLPSEQSQDATPVATPSADGKVDVSLHIDADLLDQLQHLTNDPSRIIETAVRQWLRGTLPREEDIARSFPRNPPVPSRGEWND